MQAQSTTNGPNPAMMPKKKDPRMRALEKPTGKQYFDSADYEVKKHQMANKISAQGCPANPSDARKELMEQALRAPHLTTTAARMPLPLSASTPNRQ